MKKFFLAASLLIAATSFAAATTNASPVTMLSGGDDGGGKHIPSSQVPMPVLESFHSTFPNRSNAQWEKESEHGGTTYQVDFLNNGKKWRAVFAPDGTLLSSGKH